MISCFDVDLYSRNVVGVGLYQLFTSSENWCTAVTKTSGLLLIVDLEMAFKGRFVYVAYMLVVLFIWGWYGSLWLLLPSLHFGMFSMQFNLTIKVILSYIKRGQLLHDSLLCIWLYPMLYSCWGNKSLVTYNQHFTIIQFFGWFANSMSARWLKAVFKYKTRMTTPFPFHITPHYLP